VGLELVTAAADDEVGWDEAFGGERSLAEKDLVNGT
jgi:hypothetical protein